MKEIVLCVVYMGKQKKQPCKINVKKTNEDFRKKINNIKFSKSEIAIKMKAGF